MFKGTVSQDFRLLVFFHESVPPSPLVYWWQIFPPVSTTPHGSADRNPDPHQNVMDPEHWFKGTVGREYSLWFCFQYTRPNFSYLDSLIVWLQ
jgi:hypothetical protein